MTYTSMRKRCWERRDHEYLPLLNDGIHVKTKKRVSRIIHVLYQLYQIMFMFIFRNIWIEIYNCVLSNHGHITSLTELNSVSDATLPSPETISFGRELASIICIICLAKLRIRIKQWNHFPTPLPCRIHFYLAITTSLKIIWVLANLT